MMKMQESGENYLETILILQNENGHVRSIDIANKLEFTKPSISRAMGILKSAGYITMERGGRIALTEVGLQKANEIYERHQLIKEYLIRTLGVSEQTADADACRIEHVVSQETFLKIKQLIGSCQGLDAE